MRRPLVAGNWKMHGTAAEATALASEVASRTADLAGMVDVVVGPPFTALQATAAATAGTATMVAAQDMHWEVSGAYTGAVSPAMVAEWARYVILGHSERRALFHETDADVNRKVRAAYDHGLTPIVCVGETLAQRDGGQTDDVVTVQLCMALEGVAELQAERLIVAYEPVWAIGTGRPCDDLEAARVCGLIRDLLVGTCGARSADSARVLYGGSVKAENAGAYFAHASVDGALVGGASLDATSFAAIARAAAVGTGA